jgi:Transglycosylase SLT domain
MNTLAALFITQTLHFGLPPDLLSSLCFVESKHDVSAIHHDDGGTDSIGICQIKFKTAQSLGFKGSAKDLLDPQVNTYYAAKYLQHQLSRYHGDTTKAVIAYNMGSTKGFTTTKYSVRVLKQWSYELNN